MTFSSLCLKFSSFKVSPFHLFSKRSSRAQDHGTLPSSTSQMQLCICGRSLSTIPGLHSDQPHQQSDTALIHTQHQLSGESDSVPGALSGSLAGVSGALALFKFGLDIKKVFDDTKKIKQRNKLMKDLLSGSQSQQDALKHPHVRTYSFLLLNQQLKIKKQCQYAFESFQTYATTISSTVGNALMVSGKTSAAAISLGVSSLCFLGSGIWSIMTGSWMFLKTLQPSSGFDPQRSDKAVLQDNMTYFKTKERAKRGLAFLTLLPVWPIYAIYKGLKSFLFNQPSDQLKNPIDASIKWDKRLNAGLKITAGTCIVLGTFVPFAQPLLLVGMAILFAKPVFQGIKWVYSKLNPKPHYHLTDTEKVTFLQANDYSPKSSGFNNHQGEQKAIQLKPLTMAYLLKKQHILRSNQSDQEKLDALKKEQINPLVTRSKARGVQTTFSTRNRFLQCQDSCCSKTGVNLSDSNETPQIRLQNEKRKLKAEIQFVEQARRLGL